MAKQGVNLVNQITSLNDQSSQLTVDTEQVIEDKATSEANEAQYKEETFYYKKFFDTPSYATNQITNQVDLSINQVQISFYSSADTAE